jgi:hypothetical protein
VLMYQGLTLDQKNLDFPQENVLDMTILYGRMIETQGKRPEANKRNPLVDLTSGNQLCILVVEFWLVFTTFGGLP